MAAVKPTTRRVNTYKRPTLKKAVLPKKKAPARKKNPTQKTDLFGEVVKKAKIPVRKPSTSHYIDANKVGLLCAAIASALTYKEIARATNLAGLGISLSNADNSDSALSVWRKIEKEAGW